MKTWQKIKANPALLDRYLIREKVMDTIRSFFKQRGFHEVETPLLVNLPSTESNLEVFKTEIKSPQNKSSSAFLITSPEFAMKKLLAAGVGNIFQITRSFRNEEAMHGRHNPEFSILEWYRTDADYQDIMTDFEQLFLKIVEATQGKADVNQFVYQDITYDLSPPWPRIRVAEAFEQFAGIGIEALLDEKQLLVIAKEKGYTLLPSTQWEEVFNQILFNEVEPALTALKRPVFLYDYPLSEAALSKKAQDSRFAERFEVFLAGLELGNAFSELTDAAEQETRLQADLAQRKRLGKTEYGLDTDFIDALKSGLPETGGIAVGVDRLVMLMADVASVSETLFFPAGEMFDLEESF